MNPRIYSFDEHELDPKLVDRDALNVIHRLKQAGYIAYLVGGGVRDLLLKRTPKDFDISTSAKPEEIKRLFGRQCILIGRRFRLAHIRFGHKILEVSTFRRGDTSDDLILKDNEWGSEQEDVQRRDFTINGLFYDPESKSVIDYVGGWNDLKEGVLVTIGDAETRFKQDPVRMIRLLKFQARFSLKVSKEASCALNSCLSEIKKSSSARVLEEVLRMLESTASAPFFELMKQSGLLHHLSPRLAALFDGRNGVKIQKFLMASDTINKQSTRFPIERPVLMSALLFPYLEGEIQALQQKQNTAPHFGQVLGLTQNAIHEVIISSFTHFPRRISSLMSYILSTQSRLNPGQTKRPHLSRLFKIREFPMALRLLKIRALVDPDLQNIYIDWRENYRHFLRQSPHRHTKGASE